MNQLRMVHKLNTTEIANEFVIVTFRGSNVYQYWLVCHIDTLWNIPNVGLTNARDDKLRTSHCAYNVPPIALAMRNSHHSPFIDKQLSKWLRDQIRSTDDGGLYSLE